MVGDGLHGAVLTANYRESWLRLITYESRFMTFHPFPFQERYGGDTSLPCNNFGTYLIMDSKMQHEGHQRAI